MPMGYKSRKACFQIRKVRLFTIVLENRIISLQDQECPLMDSSYYWEVRADWKVAHPKSSVQHKMFSLPELYINSPLCA